MTGKRIVLFQAGAISGPRLTVAATAANDRPEHWSLRGSPFLANNLSCGRQARRQYANSQTTQQESFKSTALLTLSFSDSPVDKCSTFGTSLFFHDSDSPGPTHTTQAWVSVKNLLDYFQITTHTWLEDVKGQVLMFRGGVLGRTAVINDGLPR